MEVKEKYYKILNERLNHNGFQYKLGLNIDHMPFIPRGSCEAGGLYFTTKEYLYKFLHYGCYIADVSIPEDAKVYKDPGGDKWKADKIIIERYTLIEEHEFCDDKYFAICVVNIFKNYSTFIKRIKSYDFYLNAIRHDWTLLKDIEDQTEELCLIAVEQNAFALQYAKDQTHKICMKAIQKDAFAIQCVKEQTPELCMFAVKQNGSMLKYVKEQTPEICMEAVKQSKWNFDYVKEQTPEICMEVIKQDGHTLKHVKEQTHELCLEAVKQSGLALRFVKEQTPEICMEAVKRYGRALEYVKEQTPEICLEAVKRDGSSLRYVKEPTEEICLAAFKRGGFCIRNSELQTYQICYLYCINYPHNVQYIELDNLYEFYKDIYSKNKKTLDFMKKPLRRRLIRELGL